MPRQSPKEKNRLPGASEGEEGRGLGVGLGRGRGQEWIWKGPAGVPADARQLVHWSVGS